MRVTCCSFISLPGIGRIAVVPVLTSFFFLALIAAGPCIQTSVAQAPATAAPVSHAPANAASQASCPANAQIDIPVSSTILAKLPGPLDSGRLKVGKEIWATVPNPIAYPGCKLAAGAVLYGHVMSSVSQRDPNSSELSLAFDHADCEGRGKKEVSMRLIGLMGSSGPGTRLDEQLPMGLIRGNRSAVTTSKAQSFDDYTLNPTGAPNTVHPGIVIGLPKLKLEVGGGPACSARISSTERTVQVELGSQLILVVQSVP